MKSNYCTVLIDEQKVAKDPADPQIQRFRQIPAVEAFRRECLGAPTPSAPEPPVSAPGLHNLAVSQTAKIARAEPHQRRRTVRTSPMDRCFPLRGAGASGAAHGAAEAEVGRGGQHRGARQPPSQGRYRGICRSTFCRLRCPSTAAWAATAARAAGRKAQPKRPVPKSTAESPKKQFKEAAQAARIQQMDNAKERMKLDKLLLGDPESKDQATKDGLQQTVVVNARGFYMA